VSFPQALGGNPLPPLSFPQALGGNPRIESGCPTDNFGHDREGGCQTHAGMTEVTSLSFPQALGGNPLPTLSFPRALGGNPEGNRMVYYLYILASGKNGTLYVGVTSDLRKRIYEHKNDLVEGFTKKYAVHDLVYLEATESVKSAIAREKQIKKWNRAWKIRLIEKKNPGWNDLYSELM
jgi:putative endonuclease